MLLHQKFTTELPQLKTLSHAAAFLALMLHRRRLPRGGIIIAEPSRCTSRLLSMLVRISTSTGNFVIMHPGLGRPFILLSDPTTSCFLMASATAAAVASVLVDPRIAVVILCVLLLVPGGGLEVALHHAAAFVHAEPPSLGGAAFVVASVAVVSAVPVAASVALGFGAVSEKVSRLITIEARLRPIHAAASASAIGRPLTEFTTMLVILVGAFASPVAILVAVEAAFVSPVLPGWHRAIIHTSLTIVTKSVAAIVATATAATSRGTLLLSATPSAGRATAASASLPLVLHIGRAVVGPLAPAGGRVHAAVVLRGAGRAGVVGFAVGPVITSRRRTFPDRAASRRHSSHASAETRLVFGVVVS